MFTIVIDKREKLPWLFQELKNQSDFRLTAKRNETVDYTLEGAENFIAIERKSFIDFMNTMGLWNDSAGNRKRDRFERELIRMNRDVTNNYVIVETPLAKILNARSGWKGRLQKILLLRAIIRFKKRYPKIKWVFCKDRQDAEKTAFYLLAQAAQIVRKNAKPQFYAPENPLSISKKVLST